MNWYAEINNVSENINSTSLFSSLCWNMWECSVIIMLSIILKIIHSNSLCLVFWLIKCKLIIRRCLTLFMKLSLIILLCCHITDVSSFALLNHYDVHYDVWVKAASIIDDNILCYRKKTLHIYICYRYSKNILYHLS